MAHESFEDEEVAAVLNRDFVSIKVDREERPDVDAVYMAACQLFTGSGGWPLTVIMTPEQKPFWAGTYLPKTAAYGRMGLLELLSVIKQLWDTERETLLSKGNEIAEHLGKAKSDTAYEPDWEIILQGVHQFEWMYDSRWGGFGRAPKFPTPHNLMLLLQFSLLERDAKAQQMAEHTLRQMYKGGIFDHLGGGFSRYSTDEKWLVPHFEKMLYDNALLALAYLDAYKITGNPFYRMVIQRVFNYVLHELTDAEGGFYSGQDADSDGVEGKFYVFSKQEILQVLGETDGKLFGDWYGVTKEGNFEGKNILNLLENPRYEETPSSLTEPAAKLYDYRLHRTHLHKDDKVLTSWNALMIAAFARAARLLDAPEYGQHAQKAHRFLQKSLKGGKGNLKLRWREGEAAIDGQLDDYAFYAYAMLEMYQVAFDIEYLQEAVQMCERMLYHFWDEEQGGFFLYSRESEQLISRPKETYDGAIPSGNSVAADVLVRLSKLTGEVKWQEIAHRQLRFLAGDIQDYPAGHSMALLAISKAVYPSRELVCVTSEENAPAELVKFLAENPVLNLTVLVKTSKNQELLKQTALFTADYPIPESGTAYYLCENGACMPPVYELAPLYEKLVR